MVYYGDHDNRIRGTQKPELIDPTDAIIKMTKTAQFVERIPVVYIKS
jgi:hypothetical protein